MSGRPAFYWALVAAVSAFWFLGLLGIVAAVSSWRLRRKERRELIAAMSRGELHDSVLAMQLSPDRKLRKLGRSIR